jgi:hypothetical protein
LLFAIAATTALCGGDARRALGWVAGIGDNSTDGSASVGNPGAANDSAPSLPEERIAPQSCGLILPEGVPKSAPDIKFTGEPYNFGVPAGLNLPDGISFDEVTKKIASFVESEVLKFRQKQHEGRFDKNLEETIRNFVGWMNEKIGSNEVVPPEAVDAIKTEFQTYSARHDMKFHENWEFRLNQYLIPAGYFLSTQHGKKVVQLFKINKNERVDVSMNGSHHQVPLFQLELGPEYKDDAVVAGFNHNTSTDSQDIIAVVTSILKVTEEDKALFEKRAKELGGNIDSDRFHREFPNVDFEKAKKTVAEHEAAHTIIRNNFPQLQNSLKEYNFRIAWHGSDLHEEAIKVDTVDPNEMFAVGTQLANSDHPWIHILPKALGENNRSASGKLLMLTSIIAAPEVPLKRRLIAELESRGINPATSNQAFIDDFNRLVMSPDYKDEHAKKAGELHLQLAYSFFLQNKDRV